ncbi:phosphatidylserine decarboxylase [Magnetospira thiophila]
MLKVILVPIHPAGWPFIGLFAVITVILGGIAEPLGWIGLILTAWCAYFFRNPDRVTPIREGLIVSPADGVVQKIDRAVPPPELEMGPDERPRVCVFMNVFNVHVNRVPCGGRILKLAYRPGKFFNASLDKASEFNERQSVRLQLAETNHGAPRDIAFVQIAGLVARRIKCFVQEGQEMKTGERFGLIRFGSRVDVYLPEGIAPLVVEGQTTLAAETVIADLHGTEGQRTGEIR